MPRATRSDREDFDRLEHELAGHFEDSPISDIGRFLREQLGLVRSMAGWVGMDEAVVASFCRRCRWVLQNVPSRQSIGERFWFDIHMIRSVADEWSPNGQLLPGSVIPRAGQCRRSLAVYFEFYNRERRHQGLGCRTPWDVYQAAA
jgi:hypothetical protein